MTAPAKRPVGATPAVVVKRIRFVVDPPPGATAVRRFTQPRACVAVHEPTEPSADRPDWPEVTEHLDVAFVPPGAGREPPAGWLTPPDHPDAAAAVTVERAGVAVEWRPGRAVIRAPADRHDELLTALADFAFYEGELRKLEGEVERHETVAPADVSKAYVIRPRDRQHWPRLARLIETLYGLRLTFARLEPRLAKPSRSLPPESRRIVARLLTKADVEARLEALSDRLETCEDLYEGATDRVADYRWYRTGHRLEWGIIVLLMLEVALISVDLYIRYVEYQEPSAAEMAVEDAKGTPKK